MALSRLNRIETAADNVYKMYTRAAAGGYMTTNAIDRVKKIVASDSRWSIEDGDVVIYVDDTGFDKIASRPMGSIICAGDAMLIDEWRRWFNQPVLQFAQLPRTERVQGTVLKTITISYVQSPTCSIFTFSGWYLDFADQAKFSGSGAQFAAECFVKNRCSITSIGSAMKSDPLTGGKTVFVELETNRTNLSPNQRTLADAVEELEKRGHAFNVKTRKTMSYSDWKKDPASGAKALSAQDLSLSAPTGQPARAWTQEERDELRKILEQDFARERRDASNEG